MDHILLLYEAIKYLEKEKIEQLYQKALEKCRHTNGLGTTECFQNIIHLQYMIYLRNKL